MQSTVEQQPQSSSGFDKRTSSDVASETVQPREQTKECGYCLKPASVVESERDAVSMLFRVPNTNAGEGDVGSSHVDVRSHE